MRESLTSDGISASYSVMPIDCCEQSYAAWSQDGVNLENYSLSRLEEIRRINELSHTGSAFSCIMSFAGFLNTLAYGKQDKSSWTGDELNYHESDGKYFIDFFHTFVKRLWCKLDRKQGKAVHPRQVPSTPSYKASDFNTWGEILYSYARCSLVHNMNVIGNRDKNVRQDQIILQLTHCGDTSQNDFKIEELENNGAFALVPNTGDSIVLTLDAFSLCDSLRLAILRIFQDADASKSAVDVAASYPVLMKLR